MELPLVQCKKCKHLTTITGKYLCPFDWCENVLDSPDRDLQRRCKHYQAATNADRIRAMSDEELAKGMHAFMFGWCLKPTSECIGKCEECLLDWLKSEAK